MGRRSINTTKSGKYMNPTDQARKEARKRELKKNKKQRQMVRAAVLKGKDPSQIIMELEKIDSMEYNVEVPPALSEKVLKDKRKKLRETLDRVLKLYERENPEYWLEIRRMEGDYEKKRQALIELFESVRYAQAVTIDEIPLPNLEMPQVPPDIDGVPEIPDTIPAPVPNAHMIPAHGILKKMSVYVPQEVKRPPGCPPTLPPELSDIEDDEEMEADVDEEETKNEESDAPPRSRTIRFEDGEDEDAEEKDTRATVSSNKGLTSLQTKLLQMSGQDIDDFMRETEVLFREKAAERRADLRARLDKLDDDANPPQLQTSLLAVPPPTPGIPLPVPPVTASAQMPPANFLSSAPPTATPAAPTSTLPLPPGVAQPVVPVPASVVPPVVPQAVPPPPGPPNAPPMLFRPPPPMRTSLPPPPGIRPPPGPLPSMPPRLPNMRLPPPMPPRPIRPPGIPPPGIPPPGLPPRVLPPMSNPNVLSAGPQLIARPREDDKKHSATIEAKPQIRTTSGDVTRFLPTALRVKRDDRKKIGKTQPDVREPGVGKSEEADRKPTKDDAYSQFMREMEGLL